MRLSHQPFLLQTPAGRHSREGAGGGARFSTEDCLGKRVHSHRLGMENQAVCVHRSWKEGQQEGRERRNKGKEGNRRWREKISSSQVEPHVPVVLALKRLGQEEHCEFKASLGCTILVLRSKKNEASLVYKS